MRQFFHREQCDAVLRSDRPRSQDQRDVQASIPELFHHTLFEKSPQVDSTSTAKAEVRLGLAISLDLTREWWQIGFVSETGQGLTSVSIQLRKERINVAPPALSFQSASDMLRAAKADNLAFK